MAENITAARACEGFICYGSAGWSAWPPAVSWMGFALLMLAANALATYLTINIAATVPGVFP
jgi:hypothetical protein